MRERLTDEQLAELELGTPGPFTVKECRCARTRHEDCYAVIVRRDQEVDGDPLPLAVAHCPVGYDADLFAAAPALLAEVRELRQRPFVIGHVEGGEDSEEQMAALRAAVLAFGKDGGAVHADVERERDQVEEQAAVMREALDSACNCSPEEVGAGHHESCWVKPHVAPDAGKALLAELVALREVARAARALIPRGSNLGLAGFDQSVPLFHALANLDALKTGGADA